MALLEDEQAFLRRRRRGELTDGYARARALDAESLRILRRIRAVTALQPSVEREPDSPLARELAALCRRLGEAQQEVGELRTKLERIRRQAGPGEEFH